MVQIVEMEEISGEVVLNWDRTGLNIVPLFSWTMDKQGAKEVEFVDTKDLQVSNYHSPLWYISINKYWFSDMQCHHALMRELENSVTRPQPKAYLLLILHAVAALKDVLPFNFINTFGQKPSTLHTHNTHPY